MKASYQFAALLTLSHLGACVASRFELDECPPDAEASDRCGAAAGAAGASGEGGGSPAAGAGGAPAASGLQVPTELVGLRRARAKDVPVKLSAPAATDLNVRVDGLPPYLSAEPLTLPAGATEGVLVMRATNDAPLGVPIALRVEAKGATSGALDATINLWVMGEPGTLDESYGTGGVVTTELEDDEKGHEFAIAAAVGPDDKVVVLTVTEKVRAIFGLGDEYESRVYRYDSTGKLDTGFGTGGKATFKRDLSEEVGFDIRVLPDNRVLVAGERRTAVTTGMVGDVVDYENPRVFLSRLLANGQPDSLFGQGGSAEYAYHVEGHGQYSVSGNMFQTRVGQVAPLGDGTFFVAESDYFPGKNFFLSKASNSGSIDSSFATVRPTPTNDEPVPADEHYCVPSSVAPFDGGVLTVGTINTKVAGSTTKTKRACLEKYLPNGQRDPSFGERGRRLLDVPPDINVCKDEPTGVRVSRDGYIFVTGASIACQSGSSGQTFLARLTKSGAKDPSFGRDGRWVPVDFGRMGIPFDGFFERQDRSLVVYIFDQSAPPRLAFVSPEGVTLKDGSEDGLHPLPLVHNQDSIFNRPLQPQADGRILVVGAQKDDGQKRKQWVARIWPQ